MPETGDRVTQSHLDELRVLGAESRWVRNGDVDLHVLDYGGDLPPLLVLPGITSPAITWDFVVAPLRDLVRPVVMDLRGRGLSSPGDGYRAADFASDTQAAIAQLGLGRPIVLGHSLGARIAAALVSAATVEVASTIVIDPPLSGPDRGPYPTSREAFQAQLDQGHAGTTGDAVRVFYPKWPRAELLLRARWLETCEQDAVLATYDEFVREDFLPWWADVPAPATFILGGDSPVVTDEGRADAAIANPRAGYHAVAGAGHMVPWDNTTDFMALLRAVLQQHLAAAG
jgi:N-formylmaleamate deformylase